MEIIFLILFAVCLIAFLQCLPRLYDWYVFRKTINKIPGPPSYPLFGTVLPVLKLKKEDRLQWMYENSYKHKNGFFRSWIGSIASVTIRKPQHLEVILPSTVNIRKSFIYDAIEPWLGKGLITSTGKKWQHDRKLITPTFHFNILEQFAVIMSEKAEILVQCIEKRLSANPKESLNIFTLAVKCTLDIICETAMGVNVHAQDDDESDYAKAVQRFTEQTVNRLLRPWYHWDFIFYQTAAGKEYKSTLDTMLSFTRNVISKRRQLREKKQNGVTKDTENGDVNEFGTKKRKAFLDLLLDENENDANPLTDEELREQVDTFLFAGHDTTAAAVSWALFCLGNNLDIQEKVHEEVDDFFGDSKEPATVKDLSQLKYLERVMKESMRLYPSVPGFSRRLVEDIKLDDYVIPKNCIAFLSPYLTHRDPEVWPDPERFDPDRFLPENSKDRHPYAFVPFSAGPRNCIGQRFALIEEKILLTAILRKWRVKSVETPKDIRLYSSFILRPSNGIHLWFTPKK